jgi:hypothetical protein
MHAWVPISVFLISTTALAQNPAPQPAKEISQATMVFPALGTPLSAEITEERITKLPDGTSKTEVRISKAFRDGAGRLRTEMDMAGPTGDPATLVQIFNGADGFVAVLIPVEKTAGRIRFPKGDPSKQGVGFPFSQPGPLITAPGKRTSKTESLGKQTIDGIEYEGTRTTTTLEGQPSIIAVDEEWAAPLGWIGLIKSSGPDMQVTAKLHILDRRDPDPRLFEIPPDYLVRELTDEHPQQ